MFDYPAAIYWIIAFAVFLDIATGLAQAFYNSTLDSKVLRNGMFHKLSYVFAIVLALFLEYACNYLELGFEFKIFLPLAVYIVMTETISVFENISRMNPKLKDSPLFKLLSSAQNRRSDD